MSFDLGAYMKERAAAVDVALDRFLPPETERPETPPQGDALQRVRGRQAAAPGAGHRGGGGGGRPRGAGHARPRARSS